MGRLCEYLVRGGYLILGPSDILSEEIYGMNSVYINNSVVYKKL